jgi:hypothetical protein
VAILAKNSLVAAGWGLRETTGYLQFEDIGGWGRRERETERERITFYKYICIHI